MMLPWMKIVGPLVLAAALFGAGFQVATWKWSGKVESMKADKEAAETESARRSVLEEQWREDVRQINLELTAKQAQYNLLEEQYLEATSVPPEIVIRYRDRVETITETIVSEDCNEGVGQLFTFIQSLPERSP